MALVIDKNLVYIGEVSDYSLINQYVTDLKMKLYNDFNGNLGEDFINRSDCFLKYKNDYEGTNRALVLNIIEDGLLTYHDQQTETTNLSNIRDYLEIDHGNGLKSFLYNSFLYLSKLNDSVNVNTLSNYPVSKGDYVSLFTSSVTTFYYAISLNGVFIDPRLYLSDPSLIPSLSYNRTISILSDYSNVEYYDQPLDIIEEYNNKKLTGLSDSPFDYRNSIYVDEIGRQVKIKSSFWENLPPEYKNSSCYVKLNSLSYNYDGSVEQYISKVEFSFTGSTTYDIELQFRNEGVESGRTIKTSYANGFTVNYTEVIPGEDIVIGTLETSALIVGINVWNGERITLNMMNNYNTLSSPPFEPDPGEEYNPNGGNQNWGQGNPTVSVEGGTYDNTSDVIPEGTAISSKAGQYFNDYYILDQAQVAEVKNKIWGLSVPGFTSPSEGIITLMMMPFNLDFLSFDTTSTRVTYGNTGFDLLTNVWTLYPEYDNELSFGKITMPAYFKGFQDYSPFTKIEIYLPFIGYTPLDPLYVQDKEVEVKYNFDMTDGSFIASIYSDGVLIFKTSGQAGQTIPLTQVDNGLLQSILSGTSSLGIGLATGGIGLAMSAGSIGSSVNGAKPSMSGTTGKGGEAEWSLPLSCFMRIERPKSAVSQLYNSEKGRPSLINKKLGLCKGFNSVLKPDIKITGTKEEKDMLDTILKEGVIIK